MLCANSKNKFYFKNFPPRFLLHLRITAVVRRLSFINLIRSDYVKASDQTNNSTTFTIRISKKKKKQKQAF